MMTTTTMTMHDNGDAAPAAPPAAAAADDDDDGPRNSSENTHVWQSSSLCGRPLSTGGSCLTHLSAAPGCLPETGKRIQEWTSAGQHKKAKNHLLFLRTQLYNRKLAKRCDHTPTDACRLLIMIIIITGMNGLSLCCLLLLLFKTLR